MIVVSGIGCSSKLPDYLSINGYMTIHGRPLPIATAAKLPLELMVYLRRPGGEPDPHFDSHLFLGWVVSSIDATGARDKTDGGLDLYAATPPTKRSGAVSACSPCSSR